MWLLDNQAFSKMKRAADANIVPTADQQTEFSARFGAGDDGVPFIMSTVGNVAQISIRGVLTESPDWMAEYFGGGNTTYGDIITALALADSDPSISEAVIDIDSGGGEINGLFDAIAAMQGFSKPLTARVGNMAASAAYGLISQCDTIEAKNKATTFGSVGIVCSFGVYDDVVTITSTEAPDKRPDVSTEEGQAVIRTHLDALHELFVQAIADGRGVSVETVNKTFGRGAVMLAEESLNRGMIDGIAGVSPSHAPVNHTASNQKAEVFGETKKEGKMDLEKLKAEHAGVYAQAVADGVAKERDRVCAHITMGKASGDTETAFLAVEEGSEMTASLQAKYMAAGMNKATLEARASETPEGSENPAAPEGTQADAGDREARILAIAAKSCGVKLEA